MTIRALERMREFHNCLELQRECFGFSDIDIVPFRCFVVFNSIGGLVLGAFEADQLVGFVNSIPGIRDGVPYWHSQMMAVSRKHRNSGVGSRLKLAQREHALQRGIRRIEWTFDPLESRNAYLNISKLGAIVKQYRVNYYGEISSNLHRGLESDRVVAEWLLEQPRLMPTNDIRRIYIPADIQSLKQQSIHSAKDVQLRVREQFLRNIEDGYIAAGFEKKDEWSEYLFVRKDDDGR
jgi:predicted GNAT superfamily acetyltransferase